MKPEQWQEVERLFKIVAVNCELGQFPTGYVTNHVTIRNHEEGW